MCFLAHIHERNSSIHLVSLLNPDLLSFYARSCMAHQNSCHSKTLFQTPAVISPQDGLTPNCHFDPFSRSYFPFRSSAAALHLLKGFICHQDRSTDGEWIRNRTREPFRPLHDDHLPAFTHRNPNIPAAPAGRTGSSEDGESGQVEFH